MTLTDIAKEYRDNASLLLVRINEYKNHLGKLKRNTADWWRLNRRILHYENVYADNMSTAYHLENYYKK